jgi:DUF35 OB-fold domain, acyl-CoA-associated
LTAGAQFTADALPIKDLTHSDHVPFEICNGVVLLKGSVSRSSGSLTFPASTVCLETGARDMEPINFGPRGNLYSFSVVHVSATRPTPYIIGYVDFENGLRVLAEVRTNMPAELVCDMPVELRADDEQWFVSPVQRLEGEQA